MVSVGTVYSRGNVPFKLHTNNKLQTSGQTSCNEGDFMTGNPFGRLAEKLRFVNYLISQ